MTEKIKKTSFLEADISIGGVSLTDKVVFAKHLSVMLKAGMTIAESLQIIENQSKGKFKKAIAAILRSIEAGNSLAFALAKYPRIFSSLFVNTTYAGEASGTLEKNLENIAEQLKKSKELVDKVKGAMIYPVVVLVGTLVLGLVMSFLVLPKIIPLFEGLKMDLPLTTRMLIWISHFVQDHGTFLLVAIFLFVVSFSWLIRQAFFKPITHYLFLHTPIVKNISHNTNLANFCRTLGTLLKSGLNIVEALNITKDTVENYYYKKCLEKISDKVSQGTTLSDNLAAMEKYFPRIATSMIRVGERSGNLEETLFYLAAFYEEEVDNATKALSTAIEPILLILIGITVGGLAVSIISPIYKMTGNVNK